MPPFFYYFFFIYIFISDNTFKLKVLSILSVNIGFAYISGFYLLLNKCVNPSTVITKYEGMDTSLF